MHLNLITMTGERPEAFALCKQFMSRQDFKGSVNWIVVDDGREPQDCSFDAANWKLNHIRPNHRWKPGDNTQAMNIRAGLEALGGAYDYPVLIIEDDDFYSLNWLSKCWSVFSNTGCSLIGENRARYYNLPQRKYRQLGNQNHASLCSTAFLGKDTADLLHKLSSPGVKFIDLELWRKARSRYLFQGDSVVGIKGLPGRKGIGMGHSEAFSGTKDDAGRSTLKLWVGLFAYGAYREHNFFERS